MDYEASQSTLWDFVQTYGTHVMKSAQFGGRSVRMTQFNQVNYTHLKHQWGSLKKSALLSIICKLGDHVLCAPGHRHWNEFIEFQNYTIQEHHTYIPMQPP